MTRGLYDSRFLPVFLRYFTCHLMTAVNPGIYSGTPRGSLPGQPVFRKNRAKRLALIHFKIRKNRILKLCCCCACVHFTHKIKVYGGSDTFNPRKFSSCGCFLPLHGKILSASSVKTGFSTVKAVSLGVKCRISEARLQSFLIPLRCYKIPRQISWFLRNLWAKFCKVRNF